MACDKSTACSQLMCKRNENASNAMSSHMCVCSVARIQQVAVDLVSKLTGSPIALCMGAHNDLGARSLLHRLDADTLELIAFYAFYES
jgi:hypothetical protein